jgi:hypothetical protein
MHNLHFFNEGAFGSDKQTIFYSSPAKNNLSGLCGFRNVFINWVGRLVKEIPQNINVTLRNLIF